MPTKYNAGKAVPSEMLQPIPRGEHHFEITAAVLGKSKSTGVDMVTATMKVVDGEARGRMVKYYVMLHPEGHPSVGMTLHFLKTIGEPYEGEFEVNEARWVGKHLIGTVEWENFNGSPTSKVKKVRPWEGVMPVEEVPF